jgi:sigma-E factor negative regulatory protein RseC
VKEQGILTKVISGKVVEVAFSKSSACAGCGACREIGQNMVGVEAINEIGAKVQDLVEIEIPSGEVVKSSMVVYLLPVLMLIVGYLIGAAGARWMGSETLSEVSGIMFAIVFLIASFFVVRWYDKNIETKSALRAKIIRKI